MSVNTRQESKRAIHKETKDDDMMTGIIKELTAIKETKEITNDQVSGWAKREVVGTAKHYTWDN